MKGRTTFSSPSMPPAIRLEDVVAYLETLDSNGRSMQIPHTKTSSLMPTESLSVPMSNEELKLPAPLPEAAGSLRSPAASIMVRRSLTPAR